MCWLTDVHDIWYPQLRFSSDHDTMLWILLFFMLNLCYSRSNSARHGKHPKFLVFYSNFNSTSSSCMWAQVHILHGNFTFYYTVCVSSRHPTDVGWSLNNIKINRQKNILTKFNEYQQSSKEIKLLNYLGNHKGIIETNITITRSRA